MGDIYREYLRGLDAAGMDLFVDFQFTGQAGAAPWGDFAKFHRMDEPLATAYRYAAVVSAADGSLWNVTPPPPPPVVSIGSAMAIEGGSGWRWMTFTLTLSAAAAQPVTVRWSTANGTAVAGRDYVRAAGAVTFAAGQLTQTLRVAVIGDRLREVNETFRVALASPSGARLSDTAWLGIGTILDDDTAAHRAAALAMLAAASLQTTTKQ